METDKIKLVQEVIHTLTCWHEEAFRQYRNAWPSEELGFKHQAINYRNLITKLEEAIK